MKKNKSNDERLRDLLRGDVPDGAHDFFEGRLRHKLDRVDACRPANGWARRLPWLLAVAVLIVCHRQAWEGVLALSRGVVEVVGKLDLLGSVDVRWVLAGGLAVVCGVLVYPVAKRWL